MWGRPNLKRSQLEPELQKLFEGTYQLMLGRDLSGQPDLFGRLLNVQGLFIYKQSGHWFSRLIFEFHFDVILYNVIEMNQVGVPANYIKVRIRDLQEFPYVAAIRIRVDVNR